MKFTLRGSRFDNTPEKETIHLNPALILSIRQWESWADLEMVNGKVYAVEGDADVLASLVFRGNHV